MTAERYAPETAAESGQEIVGLYHRFAYEVAATLVSPGDRVLDIGFGDGYGAEILSRAQYVGLEVDADCVSHASGRYPGEFRLYDGETLPDERFDLAVCFQVIEHLEHPALHLKSLSEVVGRAVFTTPNRELRLEPGEKPWNRYHVREYSRDELASLLGTYFANVEVSYIRSPKEIEEVELGRINRARKMARIDKLGLARRLPESIDRRLRASLRKGLPEATVDLTLDGFYLDDTPGLDLLAIVG